MSAGLFLSVCLMLAAALGYSLATIGMKMASDVFGPAAAALLIAGFAAAAVSEIILMRGMALGVLYLTIIAIETLVVLTYAFSIGEGLTARQALGGLFVLGGLAVISI